MDGLTVLVGPTSHKLVTQSRTGYGVNYTGVEGLTVKLCIL